MTGTNRATDASRFLAQSQGRLSFTQQDADERVTNRSRNQSRNPLDRRRLGNSSRYVQRPNMANPYQPSGSYLSRFPFSSRRPQETQVPLFSSQTFEQEDDEEQHERDMADFLALRESRRNFGPSHLTESSELDDNDIEAVDDGMNLFSTRNSRQIRPIEKERGRTHGRDSFYQKNPAASDISTTQTAGRRGRLVDIDLGSTIKESTEDMENAGSATNDQPPPPIQRPTATMIPRETDPEAHRANSRPPSPDEDSIPNTVALSATQLPQHDVFWAHMYKISLFAMFATFVLVWFHTTTPSSSKPLGDTIYSALTGSINLLLWDTVITVVVAMIWLALLREYVRVLVFLMLVALPVILLSFSIYPFVWSYKGAYNGDSYQDRAMRWLSFIPAISAFIWVYSVYKGRHSLGKAINILEFACRIVTQSPALVLLGFATLGTVVCFTWIWLGMFTRVFLGGHFSKVKTFIIDVNTWWLGVYFVIVYLWSLGVIAGVQRATTAATVSQWYFHRMSQPAASSNEVVKASFMHAVGPMLGSTCLSTFLALLVRLPLIVLPRRLASIITICAYSFIPTSLAALTNPLTLTYASIHSQPLSISARGLSQLHFVSKTAPTTTMNPAAFSASNGSTLIPYRLAKLLLHATRFIMSFALGFGGWVRTARSMQLAGGGFKGSLYGYLVGLIAATIGWAVLGAIEGVVGCVVDASVVCWASETGGNGGANEARYCREAGELFGEGDF